MRPALTLVLSLSLLFATLTTAEAGTNFTVRDINGRYVRLSDFKGKLLFMTFFATWCKPCLQELKHLVKLRKKYKSKGFEVLAVSLDGPETRAKVKPLAKRYKLKYPVVLDTENQVARLYNPRRAQPFSLLMKNGKVLKTHESFQVSDVPKIEEEIVENLK
jgi:peroxiredoxin